MRSIAADGIVYSVGLSVCLSVMAMSPAKAAEPIEMPFGTLTRVGPRNHVLDRGPDLRTWSGNFEREKGPAQDILGTRYTENDSAEGSTGTVYWRLNGPRAAAMRSYVKLLWPLIINHISDNKNIKDLHNRSLLHKPSICKCDKEDLA